MKILHVNKTDTLGGAAIAASRLHLGLIELGVDSQYLYARGNGELKRSHSLFPCKLGLILDSMKNRAWAKLCKLGREDGTFGCSTNAFRTNILNAIEDLSPDIVHLHWIGSNMIKIEDLSGIKVPIVWTLHDMWAFCGAEHCNLSTEGERWREGYFHLNSAGVFGWDINRWVWQRKRKNWGGVKMNLVGPSRWVSRCAQESALFRDNADVAHHCIPNGIDLSRFNCKNRKSARESYGLGESEKLLLFGAHSLRNSLKGADLLMQVLKSEQIASGGYTLGLFGQGSLGSISGVKIKHFGNINSVDELATIYSASDMTIVPSRIDNLPSVAIESIACGTPVVCFDTGGLTDIVKHLQTGYVAHAFDINDMAIGISTLAERRDEFRDSCRSFAKERFCIEKTSRAYVGLYSRIIDSLF